MNSAIPLEAKSDPIGYQFVDNIMNFLQDLEGRQMNDTAATSSITTLHISTSAVSHMVEQDQWLRLACDMGKHLTQLQHLQVGSIADSSSKQVMILDITMILLLALRIQDQIRSIAIHCQVYQGNERPASVAFLSKLMERFVCLETLQVTDLRSASAGPLLLSFSQASSLHTLVVRGSRQPQMSLTDVSLPCTCLTQALRNLIGQSNLTELSLWNLHMTPDDFDVMAQELSRNTILQKLDLKGCGDCADDYQVLVKALEQQFTLQAIVLSPEESALATMANTLVALNQVNRGSIVVEDSSLAEWFQLLRRAKDDPNATLLLLQAKPQLCDRSRLSTW